MAIPSRHALANPPERFLAVLEMVAADLDRELGGTQWAAELTANASRGAFQYATLLAYVDPADPRIRQALERTACTALAAHLAVLTPGTDPIRIPGPGGGSIEIVRTGGAPSQLKPVVQWRTGVLAAVVTRHTDALATLTAIPVERLLRLNRAPAPPWVESEVRALTSLFRNQSDAAERLEAALQVSRSMPADLEWPHDIVAPQLALARAALQGDRDAVDDAMADALERHHHHYGSQGEGDVHGQLALAPLAMACFAHDRGLTTRVESDYIPRWLIQAQPS